MITKQQIIEKTIQSEGGYVNDKSDKGGETIYGIARNFHPTWNGWKIVDSHKPLKRGEKLPCVMDKVVEFYDKNFYTPSKCNEIESNIIKMHLYDMSVNSGISRAVKILQKAVNKAHNTSIAVDGQIGRTTLSYANRKDNMGKLEKAMLEERIAYYQSIGTGSNAKFLKGWLNRTKEVDSWIRSQKDN